MRVKIEDWVHHNYVVLDCPWEVRATIAQEPVECRLIATAVEIEVRQSLLTRLFRLKPRVTLIREPGLYDYFYDGKELAIRGIIETQGSVIKVKPDIVFQDMIEFRTYQEFIRHVYDRLDATVNKALNTVGDLLARSLDVLRNNVEVVNRLSAIIASEGRYNVSVANLVNAILSGMGISIDTAVQVFNEIMSRYAQYVTQPPQPPTKIPGIAVAGQGQQQQAQQQGGGQ